MLEARTHDWQPIETAPRDGTPIRLRSPSYAPAQPLWWDKKKRRWATWTFAVARRIEGWWDEEEEAPTHWMPIPDA